MRWGSQARWLSRGVEPFSRSPTPDKWMRRIDAAITVFIVIVAIVLVIAALVSGGIALSLYQLTQWMRTN